MEIACTKCNTTVTRSPSEVARVTNVFCSNSCKSTWLAENGNMPYKRDEYSSFRYPLVRIRKNSQRTGIAVAVELEDLKRQWEFQECKCPITGWDMELPETSHRKGPSNPKRASLDRINSSGNYTPDNIQWVCLIANYAKNGWTDEDVIAFGKAVAQHHA